jgi:hypothetical protein
MDAICQFTSAHFLLFEFKRWLLQSDQFLVLLLQSEHYGARAFYMPTQLDWRKM